MSLSLCAIIVLICVEMEIRVHMFVIYIELGGFHVHVLHPSLEQKDFTCTHSYYIETEDLTYTYSPYIGTEEVPCTSALHSHLLMLLSHALRIIKFILIGFHVRAFTLHPFRRHARTRIHYTLKHKSALHKCLARSSLMMLSHTLSIVMIVLIWIFTFTHSYYIETEVFLTHTSFDVVDS